MSDRGTRPFGPLHRFAPPYPAHQRAICRGYRYHPRVFITPPWPEIFVNDPERRHNFDDAVAEYERLIEAYPSLGYEVVLLPKTETTERADFVMRALTM
ncbi:MAG: AAA family ATPase [Rhizomicrobium sp.]